MALKRALQVVNFLPVPVADRAMEAIPIFADYTFDGTEVTNDVIEMCPLPKGYVPVDGTADAEDAGTTVTANCGLLTGEYGVNDPARTCGAQFMSGKALGTAGIYRFDVVGFSRVAPTTADRSIGFALSSVSAPTAGAKLRLTVMVRPAIEGV
jgi:hypothetical protein